MVEAEPVVEDRTAAVVNGLSMSSAALGLQKAQRRKWAVIHRLILVDYMPIPVDLDAHTPILVEGCVGHGYLP